MNINLGALFARRDAATRERRQRDEKNLDLAKMERLRMRHEARRAQCARLQERVLEERDEAQRHAHAFRFLSDKARALLKRPIDEIADTPTEELEALEIDVLSFDGWVRCRRRMAHLQKDAAQAGGELMQSARLMERLESYVQEVLK